MLITAAYEGPPYNPVTPTPPVAVTLPPDASVQPSPLSGLGHRDLYPIARTPGCVNCVRGLGANLPDTNGVKSGLMILGVLAVIAIGLTIKGMGKK